MGAVPSFWGLHFKKGRANPSETLLKSRGFARGSVGRGRCQKLWVEGCCVPGRTVCKAARSCAVRGELRGCCTSQNCGLHPSCALFPPLKPLHAAGGERGQDEGKGAARRRPRAAPRQASACSVRAAPRASRAGPYNYGRQRGPGRGPILHAMVPAGSPGWRGVQGVGGEFWPLHSKSR